MAIDKKNKILFIHPDKCAGKSIEQQLFNFTWGSGMRGSHHYHLDAGHYFGDDTFNIRRCVVMRLMIIINLL